MEAAGRKTAEPLKAKLLAAMKNASGFLLPGGVIVRRKTWQVDEHTRKASIATKITVTVMRLRKQRGCRQ
jgi:hypothetical protein